MTSSRRPLHLVGVGASAGGVEALRDLVGGLDPQLPAAVLIVLHQPAAARTVLPELLARHAAVPVAHARDGEEIVAGRVYVSPPDRHLLVDGDRILLTRGPKENGHRPGVDPLFRSLAAAAGRSAVGVVLSGVLDDGAAGLLDLVRHGGVALVQEPEDAQYDGMPLAALRQVPGAFTHPAAELAPAIGEVVARPVLGPGRTTDRLRWEVAVSLLEAGATPDDGPPGPPVGLACPDCAAPLFDLSEGLLLRYRCRVGHAWSQESLGVEQDRGVETALYVALRALEDKVALQRRVTASAAAQGAGSVAEQARRSGVEAGVAARALRAVLEGRVREDGSVALRAAVGENPRP